jgi:alkylation response protein AidB-like acyl-CoA dehydrogenase
MVAMPTQPSRGEALRDDIRRFVAENRPPPTRGAGRADRLAAQRDWAATMFDSGFAGPAWPVEFGGMNLSFTDQIVYYEEFARANAPAHPGNGPSIAGPTLIGFATAEQKSRYLPAMLRADQIWAQGFSEPGSGSDLPSLTTTARRAGPDYIVNGVKIWSSYADVADMMFTLVRTGSRESGANGISYLLIDLRVPGVTVRPLRDISGESRFCQVFFDDVRVPVTNRVGEENNGWRLARTTLGNERAARSLSQASAYRRRLDSLTRLLRDRGLLDDGYARDRLADCEVRVRILKFNAIRTIAQLTGTGSPGPASSTSRLYHTMVEQALYELAVDLLGPAGLIAGGDASIQSGRWLTGFLHSRGATIGAGTAEIQRNTIAEQVLGLPRDPTPANLSHPRGRPIPSVSDDVDG